MQAAELAVLDWLQAHLRCDFLDAVMPWISRICDHGEIWILLAAVLLLLREAPLDRDVPVLCADSGSDLLQYRSETPGRPDPALLGEYRGGAADSTPGGRASFPLGAHGGVLCGGVRPPGLRQPPLWKPALVLAAGIAFSRLYLYVHWPTDVLGGILVGAAGWLGRRAGWQTILRRRRERLGRRA